MNFQERLAWLRRMPTKWRVLFGVQGMIMFAAINIRLGDIERARLADAKKAERDAELAVDGTVSGKRGATIVTRSTTGVERRREDM